jgi:hypothetical protein
MWKIKEDEVTRAMMQKVSTNFDRKRHVQTEPQTCMEH